MTEVTKIKRIEEAGVIEAATSVLSSGGVQQFAQSLHFAGYQQQTEVIN